ncbi:flagellar basal body rod protein FlgB, partial [bacterium]|nr:flagellar basal body rod protein FlgB [bacterium]
MRTIDVAKKGLDAAALRHEVMANNIANLNTPGFKAERVNFEDELRRALMKEEEMGSITTHSRHIKFGGKPDLIDVRPEIVGTQDLIYRNDNSTVDLDYEMTQMAKNSMMYEALVTRISGKFRLLNSVIRSR